MDSMMEMILQGSAGIAFAACVTMGVNYLVKRGAEPGWAAFAVSVAVGLVAVAYAALPSVVQEAMKGPAALGAAVMAAALQVSGWVGQYKATRKNGE